MKLSLRIFFSILLAAFWMSACSSGTTASNDEPQQDADGGQQTDDGQLDGGSDDDQADGTGDQAADQAGDPGDQDPQLPVVRFRTSGQVTSENVRSVTAQLVLSKPAGRDISVHYELSGSATSGEDYSVADGSQSPVTILTAENSINLQIHIMGDGIDEPTEEIKLTLTEATGALVGSPESHTIILIGLNPLDDIKPGHWFEVPNSHLADHLPDPIPPNWGGPGSIIGAWSGGAYDWERDRLVVWGGGHADYSGNEIYVFDLNTLSWSRTWGPTPNDQIPDDGQTYEVYLDGNPSSRHTYEGLEYIPSPTDRFWSQGGSCWKGGNGSNATWLFDFGGLVWERATDSPDSMYGVVSAWDPVSGHIFHQGQNDFLEYDPVADNYSVRGDYSEGWWNDKMTGEIEPNARLFVAIGQEDVNVWTLDTFERQNPTTTGGDNVVNANAPGFVWDSQKQRLVAWVGGTSVWHLDVSDWSWTEEPAVGENAITPTAPDSKGCYGRFRYVDTYHAVIVVNSIDENVFIYKLRDDI